MLDGYVINLYNNYSDKNILAWNSEIGDGVTPPGEYICTIVSANTNNDGIINIRLEIARGDFAGDRLDYKIFTSNEKTCMDKLKRLGAAAGIKRGTVFNTLDEYFIAIEGKSITATVVNNEGRGKWEGRIFANVSEVKPL